MGRRIPALPELQIFVFSSSLRGGERIPGFLFEPKRENEERNGKGGKRRAGRQPVKHLHFLSPLRK